MQKWQCFIKTRTLKALFYEEYIRCNVYNLKTEYFQLWFLYKSYLRISTTVIKYFWAKKKVFQIIN